MEKLAPGSIGSQAESATSQFLMENGLEILQRNYKCRQGELDLIAKDGNTIVFVEVRYRKNTRFGTPYETVNHAKQAKLIATAQTFLSRHSWANKMAARFDVVSITGDPQRGSINWIKNAFDA